MTKLWNLRYTTRLFLLLACVGCAAAAYQFFYHTDNSDSIQISNIQLTPLESTDVPPSPEKSLRTLLLELTWIAYAPTHFNPHRKQLPSVESVRADLKVLQQAGFSGLVTYGMDVIAGDAVALPRIAREVGFRGVILGVWHPGDPDELVKAKAAARADNVLGLVVGNEGLHMRYDYATLKGAIQEVRQATGKPVTTTEEIDDYADTQLLELGDWVFPNAHPYWHGITAPEQAVQWTGQGFRALQARTHKPVLLKEVGLPSAGNPSVNERNQARYYRLLKEIGMPFVYFEAFDQPWKAHASVELHWGLFRQDRSPKLIAQWLLGGH